MGSDHSRHFKRTCRAIVFYTLTFLGEALLDTGNERGILRCGENDATNGCEYDACEVV